MNHSTPGLPVHHQLPDSTQTHVHWVSDAIQPPHPLSYSIKSNFKWFIQFSSVAQSCPTLCDPMDTRLPCPSPTPGAYSSSCPSSWWGHSIISSSATPFSFCLWSFPASGSFPMSQLFESGGQSIGVSASISVLPMNTQDWSLGWTGWISLQSKGLSRVFSNTTVQKRNSSALSFLHSPTLTSIHDHWENHSLD